jgi:cation diffusion facilitator CzcD-associated flavoprotein CzcO
MGLSLGNNNHYHIVSTTFFQPREGMAQRQTDIAIIGAGPQALTLVTHILQKKAKVRSHLQVFDPSGAWMTRWRH